MVSNGMAISAVQPSSSMVVRASQMPSHGLLKPFPPRESSASPSDPAAETWK